MIMVEGDLFLAAKYSVLYVTIIIIFTMCVYIYICIFLLYMKLNE